MAYTIKFLSGDLNKHLKIIDYLNERMAKENIFRAKLSYSFDKKLNPLILVSQVRLLKAKQYCGNHPGKCELTGRKKPIARFLEWSDWIRFNNFVNRVLNRFHCNADVWSLPHDVKGKFFIRLGLKPRIHYDWEETFNKWGCAIRVWNNGTSDQFEA